MIKDLILKADNDELDNHIITHTIAAPLFTEDDLKNIKDYTTSLKKRGKKKDPVEYIEVVASFDIETTSVIYNDHKVAFMWCWQMCIDDVLIIGRTWEEYKHTLNIIKSYFNLSETRRLILWVHNLSHEFQYLKGVFSDFDIFAPEKREPLSAYNNGFEYRDSFRLSGYALRDLNKDMDCKTIQKKADGEHSDLDYKKTRHHLTPMTREELLYCMYDVITVCVYIYEKLQKGERYSNIPLTKTGYTRKKIVAHCINDKENKNDCLKFKSTINNLTLTKELYEQARETFMGGFTHSNPFNTGIKLDHVYGVDFNSSYPAVMCYHKYPLTQPQKVTKFTRPVKDVLQECLDKEIAFMAKFTFYDLDETFIYEHYLSDSKCKIEGYADVERTEADINGRVISASKCTVYLTDVDYRIICQTYTWSKMTVEDCYIMRYEYLPKTLIKTILDCYRDKTALKDIPGKELEYSSGKVTINGIFGVEVERVDHEEWTYEGEWKQLPNNLEEKLSKYNDSKNRTTYYIVGLWITAWARFELWKDIILCGEDYIYADTDSIKYLNHEKHEWHFEKHDKETQAALNKMCKYYDIDQSLTRPKTIKGVEKPLGAWDVEYEDVSFKTLGAKRYMIEDHGKFKTTIAGLSKAKGLKWILKEAEKKNVSPFEIFDDQMTVPAGETGKLTTTYIDTEEDIFITDYTGKSAEVHSIGGVYFEDASFSLSLVGLLKDVILENQTQHFI